MECFEGKIEMSTALRTPFPRTRSVWSHFLFSGVSLDRTDAQENLATPKTKHPVSQQILLELNFVIKSFMQPNVE